MAKRNPETTKKPTITISEEMHREIRILAAEKNESLQHVGEDLIRRGLDARKAQTAATP